MGAKIIGVISIKGGVGKTVTTSNIGAALAELGKHTLLVDADFSSPSLGLHFGLVKPKKSLAHVFRGDITPYEAVHEHSKNLDILPCTLFKGTVNPYLLKDKIKSLRKLYDYILIDASPTLSNDMLATMVASDELLVVTSPDYPTLSATLRAINVAKRKKTPIMGMVLNKVRGKRFELSKNEIEELAEVPIIGVVKDDVHVPASVAGTRSVIEHKPRTHSSRAFRRIAAHLADVDYSQSFFGPMRSWFSRRGQ